MGLVLDVEGLAAGLFIYGYPVLEPKERVLNVQVCGPLDIGLMKFDTIAGRSFRKDFYDLYFIAQRIPLAELFARSAEKYPARAVLGCACLALWWYSRLPTDRMTRSY